VPPLHRGPVRDPAGWRPASLRRRLVRRGRVPGLRTAKTTLAAVLSFAVAQRLGTSAEPVLAPLTALLVVQLTMYETVSSGLGRIVSVLAGVLVAVGVADVVGLTWWSLGAVVAGSLVLGRLLRLGEHLYEVPISAMIVLAVGGSANVAAGRVYETLIGAVVGVAVNVLIAPPLYIQPAADAVAELAERMSGFLRELAGALRGGWSREAADHWLDRARELGAEVARADRTLARTEESSRFNPRGGRARDAQPRLRVGLTGLEHSYVSLRSLCRALLDRTFFVPAEEQGEAFSEQVRATLADVLDAAARAVGSVGAATSAPGSAAPSSPPTASALAAVGEQLPEMQRLRDRLSELLLVDPHADPAAWQQHGALLAAVDRLRVEVEAAVAPTQEPWRAVPVTDRQRQALRRAGARARRPRG
jgi:Aromatic acid exporter family member 1